MRLMGSLSFVATSSLFLWLSTLVSLVSAVGASERVKLDAFTVELHPVPDALNQSQVFVVRYEVERVLADYLQEDVDWPEGVQVTFVGVARILENIYLASESAVRVTFDGLVYFSDTATGRLPDRNRMLELMAAALTPDALLASLQPSFQTIESVVLDQHLTDAPTLAPTPVPTVATVAPALVVPVPVPVTTPPPQSISGIGQADPASSSSSIRSASEDLPTIMGATVGGLVVVFAVGLLLAKNRRRQADVAWKTEDISKGLGLEEDGAPTKGGSPTKTMPLSEDMEEEYSSQNASKGLELLSTNAIKSGARELTYKDGDSSSSSPPPLAMTDASGADSDLDYDVEDPHSSEWDAIEMNSTSHDWNSMVNGDTALRPVESFEQQRRQQHTHILKKDMLQSPGLSTMNYHPGLLGAEEVPDHCALSPTDMSAATLAIKTRDDSDNSSDGDHNFRQKKQASYVSSGFGALLPQFSSWFGGSDQTLTQTKHSSHRQSDDEDTFGDEVQSDWDPDDTSQSDSNSDVFNAKVENKDEQSLLNDSLKQESYKMQRIRTPPAGAPLTASRRRTRSSKKTTKTSRSSSGPVGPIRHEAQGDSSDDEYSSSVFVL